MANELVKLLNHTDAKKEISLRYNIFEKIGKNMHWIIIDAYDKIASIYHRIKI